MKTYQDLLKVEDNEKNRMMFCLSAIREHQQSPKYRLAEAAHMYYRNLNPTIMRVQKFIYNAMGQSVPDIYSANNKIPSNLYHYLVTQEIETLLGNGATFGKKETKERLGKDFDQRLQEVAKNAINGSCGYGFWNYDHIEAFDYLEFVPLYDEYDGSLKAGIRYWQIDAAKPLCVTLYELDGVTEYIRESGKDMEIRVPKRAYKSTRIQSKAEGEITIEGGNYGSFPIVPMYNEDKQSAIVGKQNTLDAYDLTLSQMVNNVDDGNFIYWVLKNCGGMDAVDDEQFVSQLKMTHVAHADGDTGMGVDAHTIEAPYAANSTTLEKLRMQLFDDFMALDVKTIAGGAVTATQIEAAYEPLNSKCDQLEYNVLDFVHHILELAGIDDEVSFARSKIVNVAEEIQMLVTASGYLDGQYITERILTLLGDIDKVKEVLARMDEESMRKFAAIVDMQNQNEGDEE